jgi:hypothetical protein
MGDDHYVQRTEIVKTKRDQNKLQRWVVTPMKNLMQWEIKDSKKDRVSA